MSQPLIVQVGEALYGPHWVRPLAAALGVSERTMRYWQAGTIKPPAGAWADLSRMCGERSKELASLAKSLKSP